MKQSQPPNQYKRSPAPAPSSTLRLVKNLRSPAQGKEQEESKESIEQSRKVAQLNQYLKEKEGFKKPPVAPQSDKTDSIESVSKVKEIAEHSMGNVSRTYAWINDFNSRKENLTKSPDKAGLYSTTPGKVPSAEKVQNTDSTQVKSPSHGYQSFSFRSPSPPGKEGGNKMQQIKAEIASLMQKIDSASKTIVTNYDSSSTSNVFSNPYSPKSTLQTITESKNLNDYANSLQNKQVSSSLEPDINREETITDPDQVEVERQLNSSISPIKNDDFLKSHLFEDKDVTTHSMRTEEKKENAHHMAEYYVLRRNFENIQKLYEESEKVKAEQEKRIEELETDRSEAHIRYELEIDNLKLKNIEMSSKVRLLEEKSEFAEIFVVYENDIAKLESDIQSLQKEITEICLLEDDNTRPDRAKLESYKKIIKRIELEKAALSNENNELRKKERLYKAQNKLLEDSKKKTNVMLKSCNQLEKALSEQSEILKTKENELESMVFQNAEMSFKLKEIEKHKNSQQEELSLLKDFAYNIDNDSLKKHYHKFVDNKENVMKRHDINLMVFDLLGQLKAKVQTLDNYDKKKQLLQSIEAIEFECKAIFDSYTSSQENEKRLLDLMTDVHTKLEKKATTLDVDTKALNKELRSILVKKALY